MDDETTVIDKLVVGYAELSMILREKLEMTRSLVFLGLASVLSVATLHGLSRSASAAPPQGIANGTCSLDNPRTTKESCALVVAHLENILYILKGRQAMDPEERSLRFRTERELNHARSTFRVLQDGARLGQTLTSAEHTK